MPSKFAERLMGRISPFLGDKSAEQLLLNTIDLELTPYWEALSHAKNFQHPEWAACSQCPETDRLLAELKPAKEETTR